MDLLLPYRVFSFLCVRVDNSTDYLKNVLALGNQQWSLSYETKIKTISLHSII